MSDGTHGAERSGLGQRNVEMGVAVATALFALLIIYGSIQVGVGWAVEGPQAGFFPFYVGIAILISSAVNLFSASKTAKDSVFASRSQLRQVFFMILPTAIYVGLIPWIGIYVCSAALLAVFMKWLGDYRWHTIVAVSVGIPVVTFLVFERWFLVALPKGPVEAWLGF